MSSDSLKRHGLFPVPDLPRADEADATQDGATLPLFEDKGEPQVCEFCYGTGIEVVAGKGARKCRCKQQSKTPKLIAATRIPARYADCTLQNYYPAQGKYFTSQGNAHRFAYTLARNFPAVEQGLLFTGSVGVGKTHLAAAIIRDLVETKGVPCIFYEFGSLLKEIQNSYNPISKTSELSVLMPVLETDVLVLDELGASKTTDWVRDTMMHIINTRYNEKRLTIFTTNYMDAARHERDETLEERIGVRLRSRLYEMCRTVNIEGEDYRRRYDKQ